MKTTPISLCILLQFIVSCTSSLLAQCNEEGIVLSNASFEGIPSKGSAPTGWTSCQYGQTPDIQPGNFDITLSPSMGLSYAGFYFIDSLFYPLYDSWQEGLSQQMPVSLKTDRTYHASIDLSNSSISTAGQEPGCAELELWGGFSACDHTQLLWHSGNITNYDSWVSYPIIFSPDSNYTFITFQIKGLGCSGMPYILVDNLSAFIPEYHVEAAITSNADSVCPGTQIALHAHATQGVGSYSYFWKSIGVNTDTLTAMPSQTTEYTVIAVDSNGCTSDPAKIKIHLLTPVSFKYSINPVCEGNVAGLFLTGNGGNGHYQFVLNPLGLTGDHIQFTPHREIIYSVTISDGCSTFTDTIFPIINPLPTARFSYTGSGLLTCSLTDQSLIATGSINAWSWSFGDNQFSSDMNPVHTYSTNTYYQVSLQVFSDKGCPSNSTTLALMPIPGKTDLFSQAGFSNNEIMERTSMSDLSGSITSILVFTGNGTCVREITNTFNTPAEAIQSLPLSNGIYFFKALNGKKIIKSGNVLINR